jgi:hypothetical protein
VTLFHFTVDSALESALLLFVIGTPLRHRNRRDDCLLKGETALSAVHWVSVQC